MPDDTIAIDGGTVVVPSSPLNSSTVISTFVRPRILIQDSRLILDLHRGVRPFGVLIVLWGLAAATLGVWAAYHQWHLFVVLVCIGQSLFLPIVGVILINLPSRHEFDRMKEIYRWRSTISRGEWPLKKIVAVQTILGNTVETADDSGTFRHLSYQLNLVMDDETRRVVVCCTTDGPWVTEAGRTVSEFLGIPLMGRMTKE